MARPRCWTGSCRSAGSSRTFRYSTNRSAPTAPSRATTSPTTTPLTPTTAPRETPPALSASVCNAADRHHEGQLDALPGQQARLPGLPAQAALLPEGTGAQDLAVNLRRGARPGPRDRQDRGLSDLAAPAQKGRDAVRTPQAHSEARPATTTRSQWGSR